jgi:hypothetical protein
MLNRSSPWKSRLQEDMSMILVTNFGLYSPNKYYRPSEDYMPHEFDVLGL